MLDSTSADSSNPPGVLGATAPTPTKEDCKLVELAVSERWPIPDAARSAMIEQLSGVVAEPDIIKRKPRLFLAAAKALTALSGLNLRAVDVALKAKAQGEQEERLAEMEQLVEEVMKWSKNR
jgi:hypothetical protein